MTLGEKQKNARPFSRSITANKQNIHAPGGREVSRETRLPAPLLWLSGTARPQTRRKIKTHSHLVAAEVNRAGLRWRWTGVYWLCVHPNCQACSHGDQVTGWGKPEGWRKPPKQKRQNISSEPRYVPAFLPLVYLMSFLVAMWITDDQSLCRRRFTATWWWLMNFLTADGGNFVHKL